MLAKITQQDKNILDLMNNYTNLFINSKKAANLSKNTINLYIRVLEIFYEYLAEEVSNNEFLSIKDINRYFLNGYVIKLQENGCSKRTQHLHIIIVQNFLTFIADSDIAEYRSLKDNIKGLKIKFEHKKQTTFTKEEQTRILNLAAKLDLTEKFLANRNSLLLKMLLLTGARISEILNIKWQDIEDIGDDYRVTILGKGDKERYTYLNKDDIQINLDFLKAGQPESSLVFTSAKGKKLDRKNVYSLVEGLLKKANVFKRGLHIFRHTLGTDMTEADINLSTIKEILGHSNIAITEQIYARANEKAKRNALIKRNSSYKTT